MPYGVAANRNALDAVIRFAHEQKILKRRVRPEELFASHTLELQ